MSLCLVAAFVLPSAVVVTARAQSSVQSPVPIEQAADETNNGEWESGQEMVLRVVHDKTKKPIAGVSLGTQFLAKGIVLSGGRIQPTDAQGKSIIKLSELEPSSVRFYLSKTGFVPLHPALKERFP